MGRGIRAEYLRWVQRQLHPDNPPALLEWDFSQLVLSCESLRYVRTFATQMGVQYREVRLPRIFTGDALGEQVGNQALRTVEAMLRRPPAPGASDPLIGTLDLTFPTIPLP